MKNKFRIFSILLVFALMISSVIIPTSAAIPPQKYGDVNIDRIIDIMDATAIQRYVAKIDELSNRFFEAADVDGDAKISVIDATIIQQYVAKEIDEFPAGEEYSINKYFYGVTTDCDNDKAIVGYPVTFTAHGYMDPAPTTMNLYVNDQLVAQTTEKREDHIYLHDLAYTFDKAGAYRVKITLSDKWGDTNSTVIDSWTSLYLVKDAPTDTTTPVINAITYCEYYAPSATFNVYAKFGTEPYQYKYTFYEHNREVFTTDYLDTDVLKLSDVIQGEKYLDIGEYTIKVDLKDANGKTATDTHTFTVEPIIV